MNTENTDKVAPKPLWLLYDGECSFCTKLARHFRTLFRTHAVRCAALQEPWVAPALKLNDAELLEEMRLLKPDGTFSSGAVAVVELSRFLWWAKPILWIAAIPGGFAFLNCIYKWAAQNRSCTRRTCDSLRTVAAEVTRRTAPNRVKSPSRRTVLHARKRQGTAALQNLWDFGIVSSTASTLCRLFAGVRSGHAAGFSVVSLAITLLSILALAGSPLPRWIVMWGIAAAIWFWLKIMTVLQARAAGLKPHLNLLLGYLFAWPGTDSISFFTPAKRVGNPGRPTWVSGALNVGFGAALFGIAPRCSDPLLSGWMAMAGLIFVLHFGVFKLLSASWRAKRVDAPPLMDFPLAARSLGEFWGRRWNTGFSVPARRLLFEPMRRKAGPALALLLVFLVSGIVHELAISVPARGGYGLPTLYFLFQAAAILLERSALGKRLRVGEGIRGRVFALVCAAAPAFWLFHPPFVERVILPFLHAIHSLRGALL